MKVEYLCVPIENKIVLSVEFCTGREILRMGSFQTDTPYIMDLVFEIEYYEPVNKTW